MLTMHLERSRDGAEGRWIGPVDGLRIVGRSLRVLPLNVEILRLAGDQWRDDDNSFVTLVIDSGALVYVERSRRTKGVFYGPFKHIRLVHGTIQTSKDGRQTLARFNTIDQVWHICADQSGWPSVIFFPCKQ